MARHVNLVRKAHTTTIAVVRHVPHVRAAIRQQKVTQVVFLALRVIAALVRIKQLAKKEHTPTQTI